MVKFVLKSVLGERFIYDYYPEGNMAKAGTVFVDYASDERGVSELSPEDVCYIYADHVVNYLLRNSSKDKPLKSGTVAWV